MAVPIFPEGVGLTRFYRHALTEMYYLISYSVPYSGKTAVVVSSHTVLQLGADKSKVTYTEEHQYRSETSELTTWQVMNDAGENLSSKFKEAIAGYYLDPETLKGIANVTELLMQGDAGVVPATWILNSEVDCPIP